ncbi:PREDICTED: probable polygalacturonase At3g15720 [Tarenaya hassleriana]|uniref:probable polygalacturonase At3g15720 n=1 Tax=Tarenaya hassleriana TaxID=28532 RepID=UPI00053C581C|nr:PREDICTED: probable polygalacturonase At3g15720 [Tarenaya hassleriana]
MVKMIYELLFGFLIICVGLLEFGNSADVTKFGAIGDGKTDDSKAFLKAWEKVCGANDPQTLQIPHGKNFLLQPLAFNGPCKSTIQVQLLGNLVGPESSGWLGDQKDKWIIFRGVDDLLFKGSGTIDGRGEPWWKAAKPKDDTNRPTSLCFQSCNNLQVKGFTSINSPRNHISITGCNRASISNVNLIAPEESPNTDGIDISGSNQINITDSYIGTGDDCVAVNGGSVGIIIRNVNCGPGHGLSIGSLGRNGKRETVEQVRVQNCTFNRTDNGARIKTWPGGSGYVKNITFEQITLIEAKNPIIIDQFYGHCYPNCKGGNSAVEIRDVRFIGFNGTSMSKEAIKLNCSSVCGCDNVALEQVNIKSAVRGKGIEAVCNNARVACQHSVPSVEC